MPSNCSVCYLSTNELVGIERCGHKFCNVCWGNFIKAKLLEGPSESHKIRCLNSECTLVIPFKMVKKIL